MVFILHAVAGGECHMSCVTGPPLDLKVGQWSESPSVLPYIFLTTALGLLAHIIS